MTELWRMSAVELAAALRARQVTAVDAVEASLKRIEALDSRLTAFITVGAESARAHARDLDRLGEPAGPLHGMPVAIKDLNDTAGMRTTYGSLAFRDHVPQKDDLVVARLRAAGAVVVGKTNTPEFGYGAICTNQIAGPTHNPFDLDKNSGGSSGGAAVAATTGMVPFAHGTDFGGSVRTPASFCGATSIRPTPGVIPSPRRDLGYDTLATHGVIARSVGDCALMLGALAGPDRDDPASLRVPPLGEPRPLAAPRIAVSADLGVAPVAEVVRRAFAPVAEAFSRIAPVEWAAPDCAGVIEAFHVLRFAIQRNRYGKLLDQYEELLTPTVRWAFRAGDGISAADYLAAETFRTTTYRRFHAFFDHYDVLVVPAAAVLPFRNDIGDVTEIDGKKLATIIDYLAITFIISFVGCPVVTLPTGLVDGLPFGIQLVGRPGDDATLIAFARRCERELGFVHRWPPDIAAGAAS
jgi:amidase